jgi:hypothetical protein
VDQKRKQILQKVGVKVRVRVRVRIWANGTCDLHHEDGEKKVGNSNSNPNPNLNPSSDPNPKPKPQGTISYLQP